ncbi:HPP family protein [Acinetobacter cumulans]|uniref:HPP family protein n=1 Tax=Acinetobacter cumulans TaxID=2136182 RepID=A0A498D520_9GAMM|nr:HPP family protein [Acinetobacter cumulans]RLL38862.1 HPP family protein [Acinetobacter cumulans]
MFHSKADWLNTLKPNFKVLPLKDRLLCGVGALFGLALSSLISWLVLGDINAWYIAPMGASSVLLFAVPASPLAQPWNMVVGNSIAALIGVTCAMWIPNQTEAFSVAVALAIVLMMTTDSLHPPSGAVAITAVLGGKAVQDLGYAFLFYPVLLNSVLLMAFAIFYNRLLGKPYPQRPQVNIRSADPTPTQKVSIRPVDIQQVLERQSQLLDISEYDLQKIILEAQQLANRRSLSQFSCRDIMSRQVLTLRAEDDIQSALEKFKQVNLMSLPVVGDLDRLVGNLALYEVVEWFKRAADPKASWENHVYQIMNPKVVTVRPDQPIEDLVPYFVERSFNYIPVVENQRLIGMISRADMIAALNQQIHFLKEKA